MTDPPAPTPEQMAALRDPRPLAAATALRIRVWAEDPEFLSGPDPERTEARERLRADVNALFRRRRPAALPGGYTRAELEALEQAGKAESVEAARELLAPPPPPALAPLARFRNDPIPAPVLWRDPDPDAEGSRHPDAVLSVGEVAILAAEGGTGKSTAALALALAGADAAERGRDYGAACGLRVRPGGAAVVAYEDSPARQAHRIGYLAEAARVREVPDSVRIWADPSPLFEGDPLGARGVADQGPDWETLWALIREAAPSLVIVDPVSVALAGVDVAQAGPVRAFMAALIREAEAAGCGVLLIAHSTKAARTLARESGDPGPGAIAGSASWYDAARGVLTLTRDPSDPEARILECAKANHGRSGWGAKLRERFIGSGRWAGFETAEHLTPADLRARKREAAAAARARPKARPQDAKPNGAEAPGEW